MDKSESKFGTLQALKSIHYNQAFNGYTSQHMKLFKEALTGMDEFTLTSPPDRIDAGKEDVSPTLCE